MAFKQALNVGIKVIVCMKLDILKYHKERKCILMYHINAKRLNLKRYIDR